MKFIASAILSTIVIGATVQANEIEELSWMKGTWVGDIGTMELEETWNEPKAGSIQALVRLRDGDSMIMVELIVIDEHEDSLRLRIQQWDPGMEPRETGRQSMKLVELEEKKVTFEAEDEGPLKKLTYHLKTDSEFEITVENSSGEIHTVSLKLVESD